MIIVDLTKEKFDDFHTVDFYDISTIFFDATNVLPNTVLFKIWAASIMPGFNWKQYIDVDSDLKLKETIRDNGSYSITVQGFGLITFNDVIGGKITITPYDKGVFLKNKKGKEVEFHREWNLEKIDNECFEYWLDTKIYFPYGACDLKLYTKGNVSFEFDYKDCVKGLDFITNPKRQETFYGYLKDKSLTTNSYEYENLDPLL